MTEHQTKTNAATWPSVLHEDSAQSALSRFGKYSALGDNSRSVDLGQNMPILGRNSQESLWIRESQVPCTQYSLLSTVDTAN